MDKDEKDKKDRRQPRIAKESMQRLVDIKEQLAQNRTRYDEVWKEAARYTNPNMMDWSDAPPQTTGRRPDDTAHIYDTTVMEASNMLADGILGYSFARNQAWFKVAIEGHDDLSGAESTWLQERAETKMYEQLSKSTWYDQGRQFVKCCADFGTAIMIREDDVYRGIPNYKTQHLKFCYIDDNEFGEADVLFRDFWISAYQAASLFGYEQLPQSIKDAYDNGKLQPYKFTQVILPPECYDLDVPQKEHKRFYSVYWADTEKDKPLMDGWYTLKPFFVWRWSRNLDGDVWGVDSPGMLQLPNVKQVNSVAADWNRLIQQQARPAIKATEGLVGRINFRPNGITYLRAGEDYGLTATTGKIEGVMADIAIKQKSINAAYYTDFFLILSHNMEKQKTATEVAGIQGEKAALMSAFYGRLATEFLEPVLEDLFAVELIAGRIPPPPDSLKAEELRIDMISPLAQMQRQYLKLGSSQQALVQILALLQVKPDILDNLDLDQHIRNVADAYGLDKRVVVDWADVQRMRQARAKQQAAMQQQVMQLEATKIGADAIGKLPSDMQTEISGQIGMGA
jgi:hypothetical protein